MIDSTFILDTYGTTFYRLCFIILMAFYAPGFKDVMGKGGLDLRCREGLRGARLEENPPEFHMYGIACTGFCESRG